MIDNMVDAHLFFIFFLFIAGIGLVLLWAKWAYNWSDRMRSTLSFIIGVAGLSTIFYQTKEIENNIDVQIEQVEKTVNQVENTVKKVDIDLLFFEQNKAIIESLNVRTDSLNAHLNRHLKITETTLDSILERLPP